MSPGTFVYLTYGPGKIYPLSFSVDRYKVPKPLRDNGKPFKTGHKAWRSLRKADYNKVTLERTGHSLSHLRKESPVEIYAFALDLLRGTREPLPRVLTKGAIEGIARSAARDSLLDRQLDTWIPGMQIKKDDYGRFIDYHGQCRVRLVASLATNELIKKTGSHWIWYNTRCGVCRLTKSYAVPATLLGTWKYPTTWWATYWERTVSCVGDSPCEKAFENEHIWQSTLRDLANECPTCHKTAAREFPLFKKGLLKMVTKIVDSVRTLFVDRPCGQKANCV